MKKPIIAFHDIETGEVTSREMTTEEFAQYTQDQKDHQEFLAALEKAALEKAALLDRLGITEDEAKLLLS